MCSEPSGEELLGWAADCTIPSPAARRTAAPPQPAPGRMEEDADSPSLKALFESMEDMQEEMLEVKATAVCVWPAGAGSYLKGRVNERRDNTGDLIGLMKGALIPGSDHKIDVSREASQ